MRQFSSVDEVYQAIGERVVGLMRQKSAPLGFAASKGKKKKTMPNCTPGKSWSCGYTCLPMSKKNCGSSLPGQSKNYADYLSKQVASTTTGNAAKPAKTPKKASTKPKNVDKKDSSIDHDAEKAKISKEFHVLYDLNNGLIKPDDVKLSVDNAKLAKEFMTKGGKIPAGVKNKLEKMQKESSSITQDEALALSSWIGGDYSAMNERLYNPSAFDESKGKAVLATNILASSALQKLAPITPGFVKKQAEKKGEEFDESKPLERHMSISDPVAFAKRYEEALKGDGIIREETFFATTHLVSDTGGIDWVKDNSNLTYRVKPKWDGTGQGRYIDHFKNSMSEGEILYPPQSKFKVTKVVAPPKFERKLSVEAEQAKNLYENAQVLQYIYGKKWKSEYKNQYGSTAPTKAQLDKASSIWSKEEVKLDTEKSKHDAKYGKDYIIEMEEI